MGLINHNEPGSHLTSKKKKSCSTSIFHTILPHYMDAIGVYNIFLWITLNKNIDQINYICYNVELLTDLTRKGPGDLLLLTPLALQC